MAPVDRIDHDGIERMDYFSSILTNWLTPPAEQLKDVIQDFYRVMVQVSTYDSMGVSSKEVLSKEMYRLHHTQSPP